ncbi:tryptophan synthase alpha chain [Candidatus Termititenax persephonae]|uniref:tryptophan synthase n=1 Tax=Candidatus Termititenax persephonae TaxID=2218525 RepID=A0A388TF16_9BACT|nr:tryptophan synthase alpha chain [Candidatus Termititenax persephonae]
MVHLIAGFPSLQGFTEAARALRAGGAEILEIQIPFSDPTADGPDITRASEAALRGGFKVRDIFKYLRAARQAGFRRILVMTYANIPYRYGIKKYVSDLQKAGVEGLIVPDLPLEDEESFYQLARQKHIAPVPVGVVGMPARRLKLLEPYHKLYISLRGGTTGTATRISAETQKFLSQLSVRHEVYGGFGITSARQVKALAPFVHAVVVGSYFTRTLQEAGRANAPIYQSVAGALRKLL